MKILHIDTGKEWRGGQRQALLLHNTLLAKGFESYLVANSKGELVKKADKNLYSLSYNNEIDVFYVKRLLKIIKKHEINIIHSHDAHSLSPGILCCLLNSQLKLIHTRRVDFSINKSFFSKLKYTNKYVSKVVAISDAIKNILINDGIDANKIVKIYSGVPKPHQPDDVKLKEIKDEFDLKDKKVICCVANFADHKDHKTLLKAFDIVNRHNEDCKLLLVGDGPLFEETMEFAESLQCFDNVIFTGYREDVYNLIRCGDIFCITSKEEGLCTSIIDALNCGKPVVATSAGGIPELVEDNINGFLCEIGNFKQVADKIINLLNNNDKAELFSKNAIEKGKEFSELKMTENYIKLYSELIPADFK